MQLPIFFPSFASLITAFRHQISCTWVAVHCIWPLLFAVIGAPSHGEDRGLAGTHVCGCCGWHLQLLIHGLLHTIPARPLPWITTRIESWLHLSNFVLAGSTYSKSGAQHSIILSSWLGMVGIWFDKNSVLWQSTTTALLWILLTPFRVVRPSPQRQQTASTCKMVWKQDNFIIKASTTPLNASASAPVCPVCRIELRTPPLSRV